MNETLKIDRFKLQMRALLATRHVTGPAPSISSLKSPPPLWISHFNSINFNVFFLAFPLKAEDKNVKDKVHNYTIYRDEYEEKNRSIIGTIFLIILTALIINFYFWKSKIKNQNYFSLRKSLFFFSHRALICILGD